MSALVLGPLLRYVDASSATLWVETSSTAVVTVTAGSHRASARTFAAHGHHYALVELVGLEPGTNTAYQVDLDGERVWPPSDSELPPSVIATLRPGKPLRMAFGSCRVSEGHDHESNQRYGVDALRAYALSMAGRTTGGTAEDQRWPDLVLFLGDQVYADETSDEMREFIHARRSTDQPPGEEIKDFEEYAHLYDLAWSLPGQPVAALDPAQRDDLRRPRHPRRLEHQLVVEAGDGSQAVVARADRRGTGVVLDLPAPGEPRACRPCGGPAVAAHRVPRGRGRARHHRPTRRARGAGRPASRLLPVELRAGLRQPGPTRRGGLAGGPAARAGPALDPGRRRAGPGSTTS